MAAGVKFFAPLVRTDGKIYESGSLLSSDKLFNLEPLSPTSKNSLAEQTEKWLRLKGGLYFYAGHACALFGDIVFVFSAALTKGRNGDASSFDTGGLASGYIRFGASTQESARREWAQRNTFYLRDWRRRLQRFVRAHFRGSSALPDRMAWERYLSGRRASHDDVEARLQHSDNERRAWTFEVRLVDSLDLKDLNVREHLLRIAMTERRFNDVKDMLLTGGATANIWRDWIVNGVVVASAVGSPHADVERWILERLQKGIW